MKTDFNGKPDFQHSSNSPKTESAKRSGKGRRSKPNPELVESNLFPLSTFIGEQLTQDHYDIIIEHILHKRKILVSGTHGAGKSYLLRGLLRTVLDLTPSPQLVSLVEIAPEIQHFDPRLLTFLYVLSNKTPKIAEIINFAMRYHPSWIIVDEPFDDQSIAALFDHWLADRVHDFGGITTVTAPNVHSAFSLLTKAYQEATGRRESLEQSVDLVVHVERASKGSHFVSQVYSKTYSNSFALAV